MIIFNEGVRKIEHLHFSTKLVKQKVFTNISKCGILKVEKTP